METVVKAIIRKPPGEELMVAGDFNVDILAPEGRRAENIATDLATAEVEDMAQHFMPRGRRWCRDRRMWDMKRQGQVVRYWTDYILGTDRRLFQNVAVRDPWHNTDHYMVLGLTEGLEDMVHHFMPRGRRWCRDRRTWDMRRQGQVVRSRTDYILGTDRHLFQNVAVRDPRHNTDHYMVLGCLPGTPLATTRRYSCYERRRDRKSVVRS